MWIIAAYGPNGYDTEVSEVETYEQAAEVYKDEVKKANPYWKGKLVIAKIESTTIFPETEPPLTK